MTRERMQLLTTWTGSAQLEVGNGHCSIALALEVADGPKVDEGRAAVLRLDRQEARALAEIISRLDVWAAEGPTT